MLFQLSIHDDATSPEGSMTVFPGAKARYTESLSFLTPSSNTEGIPVYRVMDKKGDIILPDSDPNLPDDQLLKMYKVTQGGGYPKNIRPIYCEIHQLTANIYLPIIHFGFRP